MSFKVAADKNHDDSKFITNLNKFAKKNKIDMTTTVGSGNAFELFVATVFMFNGFKIDQIVGGTGDQGGDVIVHKGTKTKKTEYIVGNFVTEERIVNTLVKYCIQCKYHSDGKNEGNKAIAQANLGVKKYKCKEGIAISSTDFTTGGYEAAKLVRIMTINGAQLSTMINKASTKQNPWTYVWSDEDLRKIGFIN